MNLAEIINHSGVFEIHMNDVAQDVTIRSEEFVINKDQIIEIIKVKPLDVNGSSPDNQITVKWQYSYGRMFETHAGIVSRGTDNGVTTWFTDDGTSSGNPDSEKFYIWAKERL